ncbi:hypothetical protein [Okeania sp. KiyG1]|uniref:hypothetical protein n=1 Tax=Okeania sp. KiyG1 TaxID=2720165 RepID=UPI0019B5D0A8|nr:hypothetical protein [Okeania sp. KiyG1]GFZ90146.1 hypothetical protein CYANOKiyG1_00490 [Okeania sp. KiyG1]
MLTKKQQKKFDKEQRFQGDKGDQGGEKIDRPKKKKETIKCHTKSRKRIKKSSKRRFVEHVIRLIKICASGTRKIQIKRE